MESSRGMKFFCMVIGFILFGMWMTLYTSKQEGYTIDEMQISMSVDGNGDCSVQEHMQAAFAYQRVSIDRMIPLFEILTDVDGRKYFQYNRILESSLEEKNGIGVGNRNVSLPVTKEYALSGKAAFDYSYSMNTAQINRTDSASLLLDIISADNRALIQKVSFHWNFPRRYKRARCNSISWMRKDI